MQRAAQFLGEAASVIRQGDAATVIDQHPSTLDRERNSVIRGVIDPANVPKLELKGSSDRCPWTRKKGREHSG